MKKIMDKDTPKGVSLLLYAAKFTEISLRSEGPLLKWLKKSAIIMPYLIVKGTVNTYGQFTRKALQSK